MNIHELREFAEQVIEYHGTAKYEATSRKNALTLVPAYLAIQLAVSGEPVGVAVAISAIRQLPTDYDGDAGHYIDKAREILTVQAAKEIYAWMYPPPPSQDEEHPSVES